RCPDRVRGKPFCGAYPLGGVFGLAVGALVSLALGAVVEAMWRWRNTAGFDVGIRLLVRSAIVLAIAGAAAAVNAKQVTTQWLPLAACVAATAMLAAASWMSWRWARWLTAAVTEENPRWLVLHVDSLHDGEPRRGVVDPMPWRLVRVEVAAAGAYRKTSTTHQVAHLPGDAASTARTSKRRSLGRGGLAVLTVLLTCTAFSSRGVARTPLVMTRRFEAEILQPWDGYAIAGVRLWSAETIQQEGQGLIRLVGWDVGAERPIEGRELFLRVSKMPAVGLAQRASDILLGRAGRSVWERSSASRDCTPRIEGRVLSFCLDDRHGVTRVDLKTAEVL
ncbi:MAG: hypothetical protein WCJ30_16245, partial [Deltaproteobacteria bacterium]